VIWQLGLITLFHFELDPFSILVPFLVFAIGVSHAAQKMNGIMQDVGRGTHKLVAARYTFRRLFLAGLTALLADAVGFGVLMVIDIPVIQDLALTASIGVAVLIFTNLLLLPVLLSAGYKEKAALGLLTGTGSLGLLFPPCLPLIFYGVIAGVDIKDMFLGGMVPGVLLVVLTAIWGISQAPRAASASFAPCPAS